MSDIKGLKDVQAIFPSAKLIRKGKQLSPYLLVSKGENVGENEKKILDAVFNRVRKVMDKK